MRASSPWRRASRPRRTPATASCSRTRPRWRPRSARTTCPRRSPTSSGSRRRRGAVAGVADALRKPPFAALAVDLPCRDPRRSAARPDRARHRLVARGCRARGPRSGAARRRARDPRVPARRGRQPLRPRVAGRRPARAARLRALARARPVGRSACSPGSGSASRWPSRPAACSRSMPPSRCRIRHSGASRRGSRSARPPPCSRSSPRRSWRRRCTSPTGAAPPGAATTGEHWVE